MAKNSITDYSKTAASNTDIQSVDIDEGCLPSGINNAIREIMADLADMNDGTVSLTSPSFAAASLTGDLSFGDGNKAIFGDNTNGDLVIQHDGTDSKIVDRGAGELLIQGSSSIRLQNFTGTQDYFVGVNNGASTIYHSGSAKLATTSTGIDVTGTVTADGLTVDGDLTVDTNTLHVDSTNNRVGIGTTSPAVRLDITPDGAGAFGELFRVKGTNTGFGQHASMRIIGGNADSTGIRIEQNGSGNSSGPIASIYNELNSSLRFGTNNSERMRITSAGLVGIGTSSPSKTFHVYHPTTNKPALIESGDAFSLLEFKDSSTTNIPAIGADGNNIIIQTGSLGAERMRIDSSGRLGIGTSSPNGKLHVKDQTDIAMSNSADGQFVIEGNGYSGAIALNATGMQIYQNSSARSIIFGNNETEQMRIDSSGNVLVGKTSTSNATTTVGFHVQPSGVAVLTRDGGAPLRLSRKTSDGEIMSFHKDGTTVGSIGTTSDDIYIGSGDTALFFDSATDSVKPRNSDGTSRDNAIDLGALSHRFDDIYATNGTIQTSDQNEKQDIEALSEAEQRVAVAAKGLLRKFRWIDSVEEKGDDARIHFGIIAQDLQAAFEAEGLDAGRYAMFINSTWTDEETGEERSRMGVRYNQLLAFIIAAI